MRVIAVINQKGGVGKTTSTVNIGAALARRGKKVLMLDLDAQANMTLHVDRQPENEDETVTYLMLEEKSVKDLMRPTESEGLWVIPADSTLGGVEQVLANRIGRETILREAFAAYKALPADEKPVEFDFILLDCPPALGVLSANALVSAAEVVIPMQAEYFSLQGMAKLTEVIQLVKARLNPEIDIALVLPCMLDTRKRLTMEVLEEIQRHFKERVSRFPIRPNVKLAEAPSFGRTIFEHDPDCNGAYDYDGVAAELLGVADELLAELAADELEEEEEEFEEEVEEDGVEDDEEDDFDDDDFDDDEFEDDEEEDEDDGDEEDAEVDVIEADEVVLEAEIVDAPKPADSADEWNEAGLIDEEPELAPLPQAAEELEPEVPEPPRVRPPIPIRPKPAEPVPTTRPEPVREVPHEIVRPRDTAISFEPIRVEGPATAEPKPAPQAAPPVPSPAPTPAPVSPPPAPIVQRPSPEKENEAEA